MAHKLPVDIQQLADALSAADRDAEALVAGLSEDLGTRRLEAGSWSVAECLDHLATAHRQYLDAMLVPVAPARERGRLRRGAAKPGLLGGLFVSSLEPPPKKWSRMRAPAKIRPRPSPPLGETYNAFVGVQAATHEFLHANHDLDLASIRFRNPFISVLRFSLATGLHVIATHNRRHLLQAWNVRRALEGAAEA